MINLIILFFCVSFTLLFIQLYSKWKIKKLSKETLSIKTQTNEKIERLKKIENLTHKKLNSIIYSEQASKSISDGIVVIDHEKIKYVNSAMVKIIGYSIEEIVNNNILNFVCECDYKKTEQLFQTNFKKAIEIEGYYHFINQCKTKKKETITLWWTVTPFNENGICYAVCKDVSRYNDKKEKIDNLIKIILSKEHGEIINGIVGEPATFITEKTIEPFEQI